MKKDILTILIIAVLLAGLMGCDAILEVFYPEFGEGEGSDNTIEIVVYLPDVQESWDSPVVAEIWANWTDGELMNPFRSKWAEWDDEAQGPVVRFWFDVPEGEYQVSVFQDINNNGWIDADEPSTMAEMFYYEDWNENDWADEEEPQWTEQNIRFPNIMEWSYITIGIDFSDIAAKAQEVATFWTDFYVIDNQNPPPSAWLELNVASGKPIKAYNVTLYDDWGYHVIDFFDDFYDGGNYWSGTVPWSDPYFVSTDALTERFGKWKYDVWVMYEDDSVSFNSYPIRVVDGATELAPYTDWHIDMVEVWGLDYEPTFLPWDESFDVILMIDETPYVFEGAVWEGRIYIDRYFMDTEGFTLQDMFFQYHGSLEPNLSYFDVVIDVNDNDIADTGDWRSRVPVGLDEYSSWDDGGKRYASFYLDPKSFVPWQP